MNIISNSSEIKDSWTLTNEANSWMQFEKSDRTKNIRQTEKYRNIYAIHNQKSQRKINLGKKPDKTFLYIKGIIYRHNKKAKMERWWAHRKNISPYIEYKHSRLLSRFEGEND